VQVAFTNNDNLRGAKTLENVQVEISKIDIPPLMEIYAYWRRVRGEKIAPSLRQFKLDELSPSIVPYTTIVDFEGPPFDYRYRFFGTMVVQVAGMELTGKRYYADNIEGFGFANSQIFPNMIETREPIATRTVWLSVKSLRYAATTLRLPLSSDGDSITGAVAVYFFE
jgi:hypothetical protein